MKSVGRRVLLVVLVFLIGACGNSDKGKQSLEGGSKRSETIATPETVAENVATTSSFNGKLIYTRQTDLLLRDLSLGGEAELIDEDVDSTILFTNPLKTAVIYGKPTGTTGIYQYELDTQTITQFLTSMPGNGRGGPSWNASLWSPDHQWVLLRGFFFEFRGVGVIRADGTGLINLDVDQNTLAFWLKDNRLLVVTRHINLNNSISLKEIFIYDPLTDQRVTAEVDLTTLLTEQDLLNWLGTQNSELAYPILGESDLLGNRLRQSPQEILYRSRKVAFDERYCDTWEIHQQSVDDESNPTVLLQVPAVAAVSDVHLLADGSLLFIRWTFPDCNFLNTPSAELVWHLADGTEQVISNQLGRIADRNNVNDSETYNFHRFALSPDEQYVAWLGVSTDEASSTLNITALASGETTLLETTANTTTGGFQYVLWLD